MLRFTEYCESPPRLEKADVQQADGLEQAREEVMFAVDAVCVYDAARQVCECLKLWVESCVDCVLNVSKSESNFSIYFVVNKAQTSIGQRRSNSQLVLSPNDVIVAGSVL
jgi:hypothetical protein